MSNKLRHRVLWVAVAALACAVGMALGRVEAGAFEKVIPKLPIVRPGAVPEIQGHGQARPPLEVKGFKPPELRWEEINKRFFPPGEKAPVPFALLSPANPIAPDKAVMGFFFPAMVDPLHSVVALGEPMKTPFPPTLVLGVRSGPKKQFVFCISVEAKGAPGTPFLVQGVGGPPTKVLPTGPYLIVRLTATSDGWHPLYITYTDPKGQWNVYGCSIGTY